MDGHGQFLFLSPDKTTLPEKPLTLTIATRIKLTKKPGVTSLSVFNVSFVLSDRILKWSEKEGFWTLAEILPIPRTCNQFLVQ